MQEGHTLAAFGRRAEVKFDRCSHSCRGLDYGVNGYAHGAYNARVGVRVLMVYQRSAQQLLRRFELYSQLESPTCWGFGSGKLLL